MSLSYLYTLYILPTEKISLVVVAVSSLSKSHLPWLVQFDHVELSYNVDQGLLIYISLEGLMLYSNGKVHLSEAQND